MAEQSTSTALVRGLNDQQRALVLAFDGHERQNDVAALIRRTVDLKAQVEAHKLGRADLRLLAGDECFVRLDEGGFAVGFRGMVTLSYLAGDIYTINGRVEHGQCIRGHKDQAEVVDPSEFDWMPTATGAAKVAASTGVNVAEERPPALVYSGETLQRVVVHMFAIGLDKAGNWRVERFISSYSPRDKLLETIAAKARYDRNGTMALTSREDHDAMAKSGKRRLFIAIEEFGDVQLGYSLDLSDNSVKSILSAIPTVRKNAMKVARTIGKRVLLTSWLGLAKLEVYQSGNDICARVPFHCWRTNLSREKIEQAARVLRDGKDVYALGDVLGDPPRVDTSRGPNRTAPIVVNQVDDPTPDSAPDEEIDPETVDGELVADDGSAPERRAESKSRQHKSSPSKPGESKQQRASLFDPVSAPMQDDRSESEVEKTGRISAAKFISANSEDELITLLGSTDIDWSAVKEMGAPDEDWLKIIQVVEKSRKRP